MPHPQHHTRDHIAPLTLFILVISCTYLLTASENSLAEIQKNNISRVTTDTSKQQVVETTNTDREKYSSSGKYRGSYIPLTGAIPLNVMHAWRVYIEDAHTHSPATGLQIYVSGGMPDHGHGLPTQPIMTHEETPGTYLIEGMQFHMPGQWTVTFDIGSQESSDKITFEVDL